MDGWMDWGGLGRCGEKGEEEGVGRRGSRKGGERGGDGDGWVGVLWVDGERLSRWLLGNIHARMRRV